MSFSEFSSYRYVFNRLDEKLKNLDDQKKYYDKWMQKYGEVFGKGENLDSIEWDLRCRKSLHEIFLSATFFIEACETFEMKCFSSFHFCAYYSLFHALCSSLFLDINSHIGGLASFRGWDFRSQREIIRRFVSAFCNKNTDIMTNDIEYLFDDLKYKQEYYSHSSSFDYMHECEEDLEKLEQILLDCYQLSSFHSLMVEKSYHKNIGRVIQFADLDEERKFDKLFYRLFSKQYKIGEERLEPSCEFLKSKLLQNGFSPEYISLDLEHQFDEFHKYKWSYIKDRNVFALEVKNIWFFIENALLQDSFKEC